MIAVLALGCSRALDPQEAVVLESFGFGWDYFNHRLSHLEVRAGVDAAQVAIIGGTSTTNEPPELPEGCELATCNEFPFVDRSDVAVGVQVLSSERTALVPATVTLTAGRDGAHGTLKARLPDHAKGEAAVLLAGLSIDTDVPLSTGASCYVPRFGWHPARIRLALGDATVDGDEVSAPVDVAFAAGNTHDPDRVCIDDVNEAAEVVFEVDATFVVGPDVESADVPFSVAASYPFSGIVSAPGEQPEPADQSLEWGLSERPVASGVAAMDWVFYPEGSGEGGEGQGAYLRTLRFGASPDGTANATSTNYSPNTQLEGFAYAVEAVARGVVFEGGSTAWSATALLDTELDADKVPVLHEVAPE